MADVSKVSIPADAQAWFQDFGRELNKRLDALQQQVNAQAARIATLEAQIVP